MIGALIFLTQPLSLLALVGLFLLVLMELRQGHIGRIGIALNAFLLWQIFYASWDLLPSWFQWYLNLGTIFASISIISYVIRESLPTEFYKMASIFYGSLSIVLVLFSALFLGIRIF